MLATIADSGHMHSHSSMLHMKPETLREWFLFTDNKKFVGTTSIINLVYQYLNGFGAIC